VEFINEKKLRFYSSRLGIVTCRIKPDFTEIQVGVYLRLVLVLLVKNMDLVGFQRENLSSLLVHLAHGQAAFLGMLLGIFWSLQMLRVLSGRRAIYVTPLARWL